jgi:hypothetical protein
MRLRVLIHGIWIENTVQLGFLSPYTLNEIEGFNFNGIWIDIV